MIEVTDKHEQLLKAGLEYFSSTPEIELAAKPSVDKWSKKEILGHLVDSAINNLQRFTEIQFHAKPYKIRKYNQDELVKANDYQNTATQEIVDFWIAINHRINSLIKKQTESSLGYEIEFDADTKSNLRYLMTDYVDHMEHHLKQIFSS